MQDLIKETVSTHDELSLRVELMTFERWENKRTSPRGLGFDHLETRRSLIIETVSISVRSGERLTDLH
jgi:hypothetical protein